LKAEIEMLKAEAEGSNRKDDLNTW
jgi:hypothetical protein